MKNYTVILFLTTLLCACASSKTVDSEYMLNNKSGLLIISLEKYSNTDSRLFYLEVFNAKNMKKLMKLHIATRKSNYINSIELPEGDYLLKNVCTYHSHYCNSSLNEHFHIEPDKALYFGRIKFNIKSKPGGGGATWRYQVIKGFRGDEAAEILKAYPNIKEEDLISTTSF